MSWQVWALLWFLLVVAAGTLLGRLAWRAVRAGLHVTEALGSAAERAAQVSASSGESGLHRP
jgi:hypothetical protein